MQAYPTEPDTQNKRKVSGSTPRDLDRPIGDTGTAPKLSLLQKICAFGRSPILPHALAVTAIVSMLAIGLFFTPASLGWFLFGCYMVVSFAPKIFTRQITFNITSVPQVPN